MLGDNQEVTNERGTVKKLRRRQEAKRNPKRAQLLLQRGKKRKSLYGCYFLVLRKGNLTIPTSDAEILRAKQKVWEQH